MSKQGKRKESLSKNLTSICEENISIDEIPKMLIKRKEVK